MPHFLRARRAAIRLFLALGAIVAAVQLFRLVLLPAIELLFQPGVEVTSGLRRSGIAAYALVAYWAYVRLVEKRTVTELRPAPLGIAVGAASGALLISLALMALFATGAYQVVAWRGLQGGLAGTAYVILIAAMLEEIVFRGIVFRILEEAWGTMAALWLQSALFALIHYSNVEPGTSNLAIVTTMVAGTLIGAFWTLVFVLSRNLWVAGANHAAWNFVVILSGAPLSGLENWRDLAPLVVKAHGPDWLTGGAFGPEDSIFAIAASVLGLVTLQSWIRRGDRDARALATGVVCRPRAATRAQPTG